MKNTQDTKFNNKTLKHK